MIKQNKTTKAFEKGLFYLTTKNNHAIIFTSDNNIIMKTKNKKQKTN